VTSLLLDQSQDTFGHALLESLSGRRTAALTLEVDDGRTFPAMDPDWFFLAESEWHPWEQAQLKNCQGPVLDLGAGAGRASLYLQRRTSSVVALDYSPGAVEVCRRRGVIDARHSNFLTGLPSDYAWRTVLLLCGNLGLAGGWNETRHLLSQLHRTCCPGAILIGDTVDPTLFADSDALAYQEARVARGNYVGDITLRLNYGANNGAWWKQTNIRIADIERLVDGTGWKLMEHLVDEPSHYVMLLSEPEEST
jgi:SAM-dependent methyltransferase